MCIAAQVYITPRANSVVKDEIQFSERAQKWPSRTENPISCERNLRILPIRHARACVCVAQIGTIYFEAAYYISDIYVAITISHSEIQIFFARRTEMDFSLFPSWDIRLYFH